MGNRSWIKIIAVILCGLSVLAWPLLRVSATTQGTYGGTVFHVTGQQIPATLTSPATLEGATTSTNVNVDFIVIANTDGSASHTVTVEDCSSPNPFILFNAYPVAAGTMWPVPMGNSRFVGCLKWSASSTSLMGTIVGSR
jgi:hypothetical protein